MIKNIYILIAVAVLTTSCGPTSKLRRAERLIAKAEAQGLKWKSDTVWQTKTVIVPEIKFDTVLRDVNFRDTITVTKDRVVTKVKIDLKEKLIYVSTDCPPDTVKIKVPIVVNKEITAKGYTTLGLIWRCAVSLLIGVVIGYILRIFLRIF